MRTDQLIRALAADTVRTPPVTTALPAALGLVALGLAAAILPVLGMRPDFGAAMMRFPVMVKQAVPLLLAFGGFGAAVRLSRPGEGPGGWLVPIALVPALVVAAAATELALLPRAEWMPAMMGESHRECLFFIGTMSLPLLAAALWGLRRGASTRPTLSGALAGLLSGGVAALVYSVHCTEDNPLFYAVWYLLAILSATALGALLGRRLLRW